MRKFLWMSMVGISALLAGCARSGLRFSANTATFPVSLTESVYDENYNLMMAEDYEVLHHFQLPFSRSTAMYLLKTKKIDLSETLTELMEQHHGDAIVNLRILGNSSTGLNTLHRPVTFLIGHATLGLIGFSNVRATIEGDVIRLINKGDTDPE